MNNLISYFVKNHLLSHVLFVAVILLGVFTWHNIGKEEMPEFASNWVRVTTIYPGAPSEDVELFVTKPMEDELKGVVGIEELATTSSLGVSSLRITLDDNYPKKDEVVQDIQDAVLRVKLPAEIRNLPRIRQFKSSEKAILDVGVFYKGQKILDVESRKKLQAFVLGFENQLLSLPEISSIDRSHYRKPELQIMVSPDKILEQEISLAQVRSQIQDYNIRAPIGSLQDRGESKITALNELDTVESFYNFFLRGNYAGHGVSLSDIATIESGFEKVNSIFKVNGHEAIFLNVKKSISTDIITAQEKISDFIENYYSLNKESPVGIVLMDDESYAVRNRIDIISSNGILGFILIIIVLFIFLDIKTGLWVAMGIPFCLSFTLIIAHLAGYTVNNMTLAGIIIVLGIVVDDAIIIAENIARSRESGLSATEAAITGTREVFKPIVASIITTCVAFVPLLFFEGFFGKLVTYIPLIVVLMLLGSLVESLFILPAHLSAPSVIFDRFKKEKTKENWFIRFERKYEKILLLFFHKRWIVLTLFFAVLTSAVWIFDSKMKFVMFPREESKEVFIKVKAPKGSTREDTSKLIYPLEEYLVASIANVVGVRSSIGLSRRGGAVKENEASILVELFPADDRGTPLNTLLKDWEGKAAEIKGLESVKFQRGRWGHGSGNAIELQVRENNDYNREKITKIISEKIKAIPGLVDVEVEDPIKKKEYLFILNQKRMVRYNVSPAKITSALRTFAEGSILYSINKGDEEVDVRLSVPAASKNNLLKLLELRVENNEGQLIYLKNIIDIKEALKPVNIVRNNYKRTTMVYGNLKPGSKITPLEVATKLETEAFPQILRDFPNAALDFKGEIEDTRESQGEFQNSILIVVCLIYLILIIMFNSLTKPLLVLAIVPFGMAGVIFVLLAHGMSIFGFFAVIGTLGMIGVVINDAIVMIDKMEKRTEGLNEGFLENIAAVATTRLRPILLTTITTVVGILPTAYGFAGYDSMLSEMMLAMGWGLAFGTIITLVLVPILYTFTKRFN